MATRTELESALRKFGVGAEISESDGRFTIRPVAFNRSQAAARRRALARIAASYDNVSMASGYAIASLT